jgi:hypothetical protein
LGIINSVALGTSRTLMELMILSVEFPAIRFELFNIGNCKTIDNVNIEIPPNLENTDYKSFVYFKILEKLMLELYK